MKGRIDGMVLDKLFYFDEVEDPAAQYETFMKLGNLDELVLAYACSIHKSQGSEYPCVVIPVHTQHYVSRRLRPERLTTWRPSPRTSGSSRH
jgi:UvrD-like helicase C-terminal domain